MCVVGLRKIMKDTVKGISESLIPPGVVKTKGGRGASVTDSMCASFQRREI